MQRFFRLFLSFVLLITGQPVWANPEQFSSQSLNESDVQRKEQDPELSVLKSIKVSDALIEHLHLTLQRKASKTPLDVFRLLDQEAFKVFDDGQYFHRNKVEHRLNQGNVELLYQGKVIHRFLIPVHSVARFNQYIVMVEKNSFDSKGGIQHLLLLDLRAYAAEIGNVAVPLFRIPIFTGDQKKGKAVSDTAANGSFEIHQAIPAFDGVSLYGAQGQKWGDSTSLSRKVLEEISLMQQTSFNIAVNLVDPQTFERSAFLIDEAKEYYEKSLDLAGEDLTRQFLNTETQRQNFQKLHDDIQNKLKLNKYAMTPADQAQRLPEEIQKELEKNALGNVALEASMKSFHQAHRESQFLLHRLRMLMASLAMPRPNGSPQLIQALGYVAGGLYSLRPEQVKEGAKQLWALKYFRYGAPAVAGALLGIMHPEQAVHYFYQMVDVVRVVTDASLGVVHNMGKTFQHGMHQVSHGFSVENLRKVYIEDGRLEKTIEGVSFLMLRLYEILGIPMLIANTWALFLDLRKVDYKEYWTASGQKLGYENAEKETSEGWLKKSYRGSTQGLYVALKVFNDRQKKFKDDYHQSLLDGNSEKIDKLYERLADEKIAALQKNGEFPSDLRKDSPEYKKQHLEIQEQMRESHQSQAYVQEIQLAVEKAESMDRGTFGKFFQSLKFWEGKRVSATLQESSKRLSGDNSGILSEVYLFMSSLREFIISYPSLTVAGKTYAYLWNYGSFAVRSYLFRPGFMGTTWFRLLFYPKYFATQVSKIAEGSEEESKEKTIYPTEMNGAYTTWFQMLKQWKNPNDPKVRELKKFEAQMIQAEGVIYEQATRQSLKALTHYLKESSELQRIYNQQGIKGLDDSVIQSLKGKNKKFFQIYFESLFQLSMHQYLTTDILQRQQKGTVEKFDGLKNVNFELAQLKQEALPFWEQMDLSEERATNIVQNLADRQNPTGKAVYQYAEEETAKLWSWSTLATRTAQDSFSQISPMNNAQTERIVVVQGQLNKPAAVARAVRSMVSTLIVGKPMELFLLFITYAGATGLLAPIQPTQHGPDSWHYLSKMVFNTNFASGVVIGVLGDVWMKLQMDVRLEKEMDHVPTGKDAQLSFGRYFWKQMWQKKNSWWENQKFANELVWKNMKPAFVTILVTYWVTLGRFELDSWVAGYLFTFLAPIYGINYKIENALEKAMGWVARNIPEEYRHHPLAMEYVNRKMQMKRNVANFFIRIYENVVSDFIFIVQTTFVPGIGPRGFLRTIFFGWSPAELSVGAIRSVTQFEGAPEVLAKTGQYCERMFFNNYTDAVKIPNPWVKK